MTFLQSFVAELLVFCAFLGLGLCAHKLSHWIEHCKSIDLEEDKRKVRRFFKKHTPRFILVITGMVFHPHTMHAIHEYAVHIVVYSGYIIKGH